MASQVTIHIVGQRLERREIETGQRRTQLPGRRGRCRAHESAKERQESGQRLAGAGRSAEEDVPAMSDSRPCDALYHRWLVELLLKPPADRFRERGKSGGGCSCCEEFHFGR